MNVYSETLSLLSELLQTGDEVDRCYAARALGALGDTRALGVLSQSLRDEDIDVCVDAATALGMIADASSVPALVESLEHESSGEICTAVTEALGNIASPASVEALLQILQERPDGLEWQDDWDSWWDVQLEAVKALSQAHADEAIPALLAFMDSEEQQDIENDVLKALVSLSGQACAAVAERVSNHDLAPLHRRRAARALGYTAWPEATKILGRALQDPAADVRVEAIEGLARLSASRYTSALILLLRDDDADVREAAVEALQRLLGPSALEDAELRATVYRLLDDPSANVRAVALQGLKGTLALYPPMAEQRAQLLVCANDCDAETAAAAMAVLAECPDTEVVERLMNVACNSAKAPRVRRQALMSLGALPYYDETVLACVHEQVTDTQQAVRLGALLALQSLERGAQGTSEADDRPLQRIMDTARGALSARDETVAAAPLRTVPPAEGAAVQEAVIHFDRDAMTRTREQPQAVPPASNTPVTPPVTAEAAPPTETTGAQSTLEAIAMGNVEAMLQSTPAETEPEALDADTAEYLRIVEQNKATVRRMKNQRTTDTVQDVRRLAIRVLGDEANDAVVQLLIEILQDEDTVLRCEAATSLGRLAQRHPDLPQLPNAMGVLITLLAMGDLETQVSCASALADLGNPSAIRPLLDALDAQDIPLRVQAVHAIAQLNTQCPKAHEMVTPLPPMRVAGKLVKILDDKEPGVRVAAARALVALMPQVTDGKFCCQTLGRIIHSVQAGGGEESRLIAQALREHDCEHSVKHLLKAVRHADDSVQRSAYLEMIETLISPDQASSDQAA